MVLVRIMPRQESSPRLHGGARVGAGRKVVYPGKTHLLQILLTEHARALLSQVQTRTALSRNDIFDHLILTYGPTLRPVRGSGLLYPGKVHEPLSLRITGRAHQIVSRLAQRSDRSPGELCEYLLRQYGATADFPTRDGDTA